MKTEIKIEAAQTHFGERFYVRTPLKNKFGVVSWLRCHSAGFKTRAEAVAFTKKPEFSRLA